MRRDIFVPRLLLIDRWPARYKPYNISREYPAANNSSTGLAVPGRDYVIASGGDNAWTVKFNSGQFLKPLTTKGTKVHEGNA
jgi:hypothetical protein